MTGLNFWIARKLLVSRKEVGFISWSGLVSIVGVAIGCLALILSIAVLNGFEKGIRDKIVGFETDIRLLVSTPRETDRVRLNDLLREIEQVDAYSFFLERKGIAVAGEARSLIWIKAVEDSLFTEVYRIGGSQTVVGTGNLPMAHLGRGIADRLGVEAGDTLRLVNPTNTQVYLGFPPMIKVRIASVYQTNLLNFDDRYCFIPLEAGRQLFGKHAIFDGVDVRLINNSATGNVMASLVPRLPKNIRLMSWKELHETLFAAMRMEKLGSIVVLSLIILVASFNIASTLLMLVMEKVREIGILRTLGASRHRIRRIFSFQGLLIGGLGLSAGSILGLFLVFVQRRWGILSLPEDIYFVKSLPVLLFWQDLIIIILLVAILIGLCVVYPAKVAGRLLPTEAIQFEK
ncbi:MAG: FtsX-like permease family protein [Candidatus Neomarinimicrobiota bacterium]